MPLTEEEDGSLPIHIACSTPGMCLQVIETLMIVYTDALHAILSQLQDPFFNMVEECKYALNAVRMLHIVTHATLVLLAYY